MSQATHRIGERSDIAQSIASLYVNEAYQEVAQAAPQALLESVQGYSLVSGDSIIALPTDYLQIINLSSDSTGSSFTLKQTNPNNADAKGYWPVGAPEEYFIFGTNVQLRPSVSSSANTTAASSGRSLKMRYWARPSDMTETSNVPSVDTEWRRAILLRAESLLHEYVGNEQESVVAHGKYLAYISSLKDAQAKRQASMNRNAISLALRRGRTR